VRHQLVRERGDFGVRQEPGQDHGTIASDHRHDRVDCRVVR
jgi:hypothetical protein